MPSAAASNVRQHAGERVLGQLGQTGQRLGHVADEVRQRGPEAVGLGQVGARLGPEHDRGALAVERAVAVAGVGQGCGGHLEADELVVADGGDRPRRDATGVDSQRFY
jgi:hypothetical protein